MEAGLTERLIALERSLLTPEVRGSVERLEALLAPDFVEFGASGRRYGRAEILAELASETPTDYRAEAFEAVALAQGLVQLRYLSLTRAADVTRRARRSSIWRLDAAGWRMVFHQGTVIADSTGPAASR